MVKIKIPRRTESDVSRMIAKGWNVSIFRGKNIYGFDDFITIEKGGVKFWIGKGSVLLGHGEHGHLVVRLGNVPYPRSDRLRGGIAGHTS